MFLFCLILQIGNSTVPPWKIPNMHFLLIRSFLVHDLFFWFSVCLSRRDIELLKTDLSLELVKKKKKKSIYILLLNVFENPHNHLWSDYDNDLLTALMVGDPEAKSRDQTGSSTIKCIYVKERESVSEQLLSTEELHLELKSAVQHSLVSFWC